MNGAIFADGSEKIGMGHIIRTMAIGDKLKNKGVNVEYICTNSSLAAFLYLKNKNYKVNNKMPLEQKFDFMIVDSYEVNTTEKLQYFYMFAKKLIYIDDLNCLNSYNIDVIVNYSVGTENLNYKDAKIRLLGPKYVPLREQFDDLRFNEPQIKVEKILLTLGAADEYNFTKNILDELLKAYPNLSYNIVLGVTNLHRDKLILSYKSENVNFYCNVDNMASIMKESHIAISAGGSTIYELCAASVPTLAIVTAINQLKFINEMHKNTKLLFTNFTNGYDANFIEKFNILYSDVDFRRQLTYNMNYLVDGKGASRIAEVIKGDNI